MLRIVLTLLGLLLMLFGILFLLQGLGVVHWPRESFMIDNRVWVLRGALVALVGAALVGASRLVPERRTRDRL